MFYVKSLKPATISAYRSSLAKPLKLLFDIDVSINPFVDFIKGLFNIRPSLPPIRIQWSLNKALALALTDKYQSNPSLEDLTLVTLFLVALATGSRVSELGALLRQQEFVKFENTGVTLSPNPNFLAKNECPQVRRSPLFIASLLKEDGTPHPLCPVEKLRAYLYKTSATRSFKIFVNYKSLQDATIQKIRLYLCKFIRASNPGSFPRTHDLRKLATSFAFFKSMSNDDMCDIVGWSSINVFRRHYVRQIEDVSSPFIVLGRTVPS